VSAISPRAVAPFVAFGLQLGVRKGMTSAYRARTGHQPPSTDDRDVSLVKVLAWTITMAAMSATVEVVVMRIMGNMADNSESDAITAGD
jgi:hypothetical protein